MRVKIENYLKEALDKLYEEDAHLICNRPYPPKESDTHHHVGERAIVFRLAHYLLNSIESDLEFSIYDLDCEYNRNGDDAKRLPSFPNGVYPDIIIHKRGSNDNNLFVCEIKTYWNNDIKNDIRKIQQFVDKTGDYKFKYGLSLIITRKRDDVVFDWRYRDEW